MDTVNLRHSEQNKNSTQVHYKQSLLYIFKSIFISDLLKKQTC